MSIKWPRHEGGLYLTHNEHKTNHETVRECIDLDSDWVSPEQKQKAVDTNDCWMLVWFPDTPVGSCRLIAADLDVLLAAAEAAE